LATILRTHEYWRRIVAFWQLSEQGWTRKALVNSLTSTEGEFIKAFLIRDTSQACHTFICHILERSRALDTRRHSAHGRTPRLKPAATFAKRAALRTCRRSRLQSGHHTAYGRTPRLKPSATFAKRAALRACRRSRLRSGRRSAHGRAPRLKLQPAARPYAASRCEAPSAPRSSRRSPPRRTALRSCRATPARCRRHKRRRRRRSGG